MFLGLDIIIWIILVVYFAGMLLMGWWSKKSAGSQEGYLLGNRQFGIWMMIMHAFGAGTNPGDAAGVVTKTTATGASGIWVSWMWLFGTPFYWLIAPVIRRMRCLTMADFFEERFGKASSVLYIFVASTGMAICLASVMLATVRTVQGMMGKPGDPWFFGILLVTTITFMVYGYWGGIVAAVRTDMVQGIMIIVLSILAVPAAFKLEEVAGFGGMLETLRSTDPSLLSLFDPKSFQLSSVILLCISAPLTALALPHLVSVCGAGKTEWEGRMGFTCGNMLKRICTLGWSVLGLAWLAYLIKSGSPINPETAFGDSIRALLSPPLQGLMLACVMAAAMSSGDAFQVTVAGLFSQNIYKTFINPKAEDKQLLGVTKITGLIIVMVSLVIAILMRKSMVKAILDYFNILGLVGISVAMGMVWRRMNTTGMFACTLSAISIFVVCRYALDLPRNFTVGLPLLAGILGGIVGSLATPPPEKEKSDAFYRKICTPIGQEHKLGLSLDEAVPESERLCTAAGLFILKPSRQTWGGFLFFLTASFACVLLMVVLLKV
ncbi:Osmoregulated proline transporter OpuE [Pontiella desulfatans]|uniref:Osmoregulated proline transporter OpuE n=1 Tax=Pontiella desulfatans TaxID=2750659 RepID=A0A6C2UF12_PONDE|nr:sodium:solute symporter family protein [Pontiella desulfatans]VGO17796.1 Osmoregulated proline transporter OpuE [Pontiella desulfatans]